MPAMLLRRAVLDRIRDGEIVAVYRRWRRPTVKAGGTLHTAIGLLAIDAVEAVSLGSLRRADATRAGFETLAELRAKIEAQRDGTLYRIDVRWVGEDPRVELREAATLSSDELAEVQHKLERMDERSQHGPWTYQVLAAIAAQPGKRAADLARRFEQERLAFKRDVRKLKALGLTESLEIGYQLSPRGKAVLAAKSQQQVGRFR